MPTLHTTRALVLLFLSLSIAQGSRRRVCNTQTRNCTLSQEQAQKLLLTPYDDLLPKLAAIRDEAPFQIKVDFLIRNRGAGIVNIDVPLPARRNVNTSVCGIGTSPTVREAVVCTVTNDIVQPPRGNAKLENIGFSTQGRPLIAVRIGDPRGQRVLVVTQQHGNEVAPTEAVFSFLKALSQSRRLRRRILRLDVLFVVRANPDGGEPNADTALEVGPFTASQGMFRQNVDPSAGGGFVADTEEGFVGVVGRGYDMNRYHHAKLDAAIRPVETQALIAVLHAFRPRYMIDMHGDIPKTMCEVDPSSVVPNAVFGSIPTAKCLPPANPVPTVLTQREQMVIVSLFADDRPPDRPLSRGERRLRNFVNVVKKLQQRLVGKVAIFSQARFGFATISSAAPIRVLPQAAQDLGILASGWEVLNFVTAVRPAVTSVTIEDGKPVPQLGLDLYVPEPCFLEDNICLHEELLRNMLRSISRKKDGGKMGKDGFCKIPLATGLIQSRPARFGWGEEANDDDSLAPLGGPFGIPVDIPGRVRMNE